MTPPAEPAEEDCGKNGRCNHGDFAREQREAGLRGRDLAGAIHAERGTGGQTSKDRVRAKHGNGHRSKK